MANYIKIMRELKDKSFYAKDSEKVHLWLHLLLSANWSEREELLGGRPIKCKAGQFTTGRKQLSIQTGISESKIERILTYFEKIEQQIAQQKTNTNRLISVLNWDKYQISEQQIKQRVNNKRTTSEQQVNTLQEYKEVKEEEKEKEVYAQFAHLKIYKFEFDKLVLAGFTQNQVDTVINRIQNYSKNSKYVSLYLTALDWLKKDFKKEIIEDSEMTHQQLKKHLWDNHHIQIDDINCFSFEQLMANYKSGKYPKKQ